MTVLQMYERVCLTTELDQRRFVNYLNDTQTEIVSLYGERIKLTAQDIDAIDDDVLLDEKFHPAIVDNILYLAGQDDKYKESFLAKSHAAFLNLWNKNARRKQVKCKGWEG